MINTSMSISIIGRNNSERIRRIKRIKINYSRIISKSIKISSITKIKISIINKIIGSIINIRINN